MTYEIPYEILLTLLVFKRETRKKILAEQEVDLLLLNKEFTQYIQMIRKKNEIDCKKYKALKSKFRASKERDRKLYDEIWKYVNSKLNMREIGTIRSMFGLSSAWEYALIEYILTNQMPKPHYLPKVKLINAPYKCDRKLLIEVYGNSESKDVEYIWKSSVEPQLKYLEDYKIKGKKYSNMQEVYQYAEEMFKKGYKGKSLYKKALVKFPCLKNRSEFNEKSLRKGRELFRKKRDIRK